MKTTEYSHLVNQLSLDERSAVISLIKGALSRRSSLVIECLEGNAASRKHYWLHLSSPPKEANPTMLNNLVKRFSANHDKIVLAQEPYDPKNYKHKFALSWKIPLSALNKLQKSINLDRQKSSLDNKLTEESTLNWCLIKLKEADIDIDEKQILMNDKTIFRNRWQSEDLKTITADIIYNRHYLVADAIVNGNFQQAYELLDEWSQYTRDPLILVKSILSNRIQRQEKLLVPTLIKALAFLTYAATTYGYRHRKQATFLYDYAKTFLAYFLSYYYFADLGRIPLLFFGFGPAFLAFQGARYMSPTIRFLTTIPFLSESILELGEAKENIKSNLTLGAIQKEPALDKDDKKIVGSILSIAFILPSLLQPNGFIGEYFTPPLIVPLGLAGMSFLGGYTSFLLFTTLIQFFFSNKGNLCAIPRSEDYYFFTIANLISSLILSLPLVSNYIGDGFLPVALIMSYMMSGFLSLLGKGEIWEVRNNLEPQSPQEKYFSAIDKQPSQGEIIQADNLVSQFIFSKPSTNTSSLDTSLKTTALKKN